MAVIRQDFNVMYLPAAIQRNNPIPLDSTAVWYDYDLMAAYAANDPTAYVGQILSLVVDNVANAYIITNLAGDLEKVGSAVVADNKTIVLDNGAVAFKDFGKRYYKYNAETEEYTLQEVDENHPWIAGLEPKVTSEAGQLVLGWFEPNSTTLEGVNSSLSTLQTSVSDLQGTVESLGIQVSLNDKALENVYTKEETLAEIAKAGHLMYKKVNSLDDVQADIDNEEANVSKTIYLVPVLEGLVNDLYDEYMVIDGKIERLGSWEVNLDNYATKDDLEGKVDKVDGYGLMSTAQTAKLATIEEGAQKNVIDEVSDEFEVTDGKLKLINLPDSADIANHKTILSLQSGIDSKVTIVPGKSLVDDTLIAKLEAMDAEGEKNVINAVDENELAIDENRTLSIVSVSGSKIAELDLNEDFKNLSNNVDSLSTDLAALNTSLQSLDTALTAYKIEVSQTYLTKSEFEDRFAWHELSDSVTT